MQAMQSSSFVWILIFAVCTRTLFSMKTGIDAFEGKSEKLNMIREEFFKIYENIPGAYGCGADSKKHRDAVYKTGGSPIYGEMLYEGIQEVVLNIFQATSEDIFMDLGSGSGKAPIEFTLLTGGRSIGLEFVQFRHELALQAHAKLSSELKPLIRFIHADMFTYKIPSATIYMINACTFVEKYSDIVNFLMKYGPNKFCVWSIGHITLPFPPETIKKIISLKPFPATWCKFQPTYLFWIEKKVAQFSKVASLSRVASSSKVANFPTVKSLSRVSSLSKVASLSKKK